MVLVRYAVIDRYTLEELRREYQGSDAKGRIHLLEKLYESNSLPPFEIALLAVEDEHVEVRQWIARHGKSLDYRDVGSINERSEILEVIRGMTGKQSSGPDQDPLAAFNLANQLKNDSDPFVRACLRENPNVFSQWASGRWTDFFTGSAHLERLALVRNPNVDTDLIKKIFDPEDKELGITLEDRIKLVFAFLSNNEVLYRLEARADLPGAKPSLVEAEFDPGSGWGWAMANKFLGTLWELATRWPRESGVPYMTYRHVPVDDDVKAQIYEKCGELLLRREILETCYDGYAKTIELGMKDIDEGCRYLAYCKVRYIEPEVLEPILQKESRVNLSALGSNRSLSADQLKRVKDRLEELGDQLGAADVEATIQTVKEQKEHARKAHVPEDWEADSLEGKVNLIGKRLLLFEQEVKDQLRALQERVLSAIKKL
jgi:hypothetical protein